MRQLIARAKDGTIPSQEVKEIARAISEGRPGPLLAVVRGGPCGRPGIRAADRHLSDPPRGPEVSGLAVQVLTGHWRMGAKYSQQILDLLGSPEWDLSDDAFVAAVSGAERSCTTSSTPNSSAPC
ncbi:hypothetical protein ACR6C2_13325 [Streptomyces sp. INA 01156]